jgi:small subunit ribosomal protein S1
VQSGENAEAESTEKPSTNIKIGSQRRQAPGKPKPQNRPADQLGEPQTPPKESIRATADPVPVPSKRGHSDDFDAEMAAALGEVELESLLGDETRAAAKSTILEPDSVHEAVVVKSDAENIFVIIASVHEAIVPKLQVDEVPENGSQLRVIIVSYNVVDELYEVRLPGASIKVEDWSDLHEGAVVEARVTGINTGGLEVQVNSIRGFIPASQVAIHRVENFEEYVEQKLMCVVNEANEMRRNLVLSHRGYLEREREEQRKILLESLAEGDVLEGTVTRLQDFGAFVDIGGVDGLIHISRMSWDRIKHPKEVLGEGEKVKVKVEKIDTQTGKIGLSLRDTQANPWDQAAAKYPETTVHKGTVTKIANFGAFVKLEPGIEGLVHISEIAHHRVTRVSSVVSEGDQVDVKVLSVDREAQKIGLSMKQAIERAPEPTDEAAADESDEPAPQPMVKARKKPLKGGTGKNSGGDQFGLNW